MQRNEIVRQLTWRRQSLVSLRWVVSIVLICRAPLRQQRPASVKFHDAASQRAAERDTTGKTDSEKILEHTKSETARHSSGSSSSSSSSSSRSRSSKMPPREAALPCTSGKPEEVVQLKPEVGEKLKLGEQHRSAR